MITLIKDLKEERETLIQEKECIITHTKEIESELTSIKVKIANRFLDNFFGDGQPTKENEPSSGMDSQLGKSYATVASKSVTIIGKLDPDVDTSNFNGDAMDEFLKSNSEYPTLQSFTKRDNIARFKFNNDADAKKAKRLMEADGKIKASVKSVSERKIEYPILKKRWSLEMKYYVVKLVESNCFRSKKVTLRFMSYPKSVKKQ